MSRARLAAALCAALGLAATARADEGIDWRAAAEEAAQLLSGYIRIDITNPPGNELAGARYLERFLRGEGIPTRVYVAAPERGNLVARLEAADPDPRRGPLGFPFDFALRHLGNPVVLALASSRLTSDRITNAMVRDTVSLTGLRAGLKHNVIPGRAEATLDARLLPDTDAAGFLQSLARAIGDPGVRIEGIPDPLPPVIEQSPVANELFAALEIEMEREIPGSISAPTQTTGGTDSSWFRARGVPAYGFIPARLPDELVASIHGNDERVSLAEIERALRVTYRVLVRLSE